MTVAGEIAGFISRLEHANVPDATYARITYRLNRFEWRELVESLQPLGFFPGDFDLNTADEMRFMGLHIRKDVRL